MNNAEIAQMLYEFAELMDLKGDVFKRNAYRKAAQSVEDLGRDVQDLVAEGNLDSIPGVGESIAKKIKELVGTGRSTELEKLRQEFPAGLVQLMSVPDVGPRSVIRLRQELGVNSLQELKEAALSHRIRGLKGFGERSEENILKGIALVEKQSGRMPLGHAYPIARDIAEHLRMRGHTHAVSLAGSLRRMRETVGDIDILAGSDSPDKVMDLFVAHPQVASVIARGGTKASVRLADGTQVDLRVVPRESYGAALQYFTGSKEHNVKLRRIAIQKGYKLNEYGVFRKDDDALVAGSDEDGIYRLLGMDPMPPEMREDRGEIEAALEHRLPNLVSMEDIKGDFHVHTSMSDGRATMREVAEEAERRGYRYIGVTDHSQSLRIAGGLSIDYLLASVEEARQLSDELGFPVLRGAEVDILEDGSLDYPDDVLAQLDYVIGSVHSRFKMDRREMTDRVLTAMSNEEMNILGHPTGRLIGKRPGYDIDLDRVMDEAQSKGVLLELNGFPDRLDLNDLNCRRAKERGVMMCIGTDAHSLGHFDNMELAVGTARRAWLEPGDILNTYSIDRVRKVFTRQRTT
ncbi:DNA polymerase/3'-5' exonuclease PolX [Methanomassiliicoccus luminyensis]|uniref:DNA polymerase/3'-5' exonuclease PolX n=1 Tax=Methanomassiliicoccus luminyensis TaxID=1080712 RepID=UPI00035EDEE8|nr:DNA polymerase/3'-5' exonuclease PolX [Methanomassiliicoccus luminyensis]